MNNDSKSLLDSLVFTASEKWNIEPEQIMENMNKIAFHESKYGTDKYKPIQEGGGPGRGMFQFELGKAEGGHTAINRLIAQNKGVVPSFLEGISQSNYDVSSLTPEQQQAIFLGNLLQMPHKKGKVPASFAGVDTDEELADYWAQHHQAGTQVGSDAQSQIVNKFLEDIAFYGR